MQSEISFNEWVDTFHPVEDEFGNPRFFDTYGDDAEFISKQNPLCIWTNIDCGDGEEIIENDIHNFNRIGFYVTEVPFKEDDFIEVIIDKDN